MLFPRLKKFITELFKGSADEGTCFVAAYKKKKSLSFPTFLFSLFTSLTVIKIWKFKSKVQKTNFSER